MTIGTVYYNWQKHQPEDDPRYNRCSPNLLQIEAELQRRWACVDLGCYGERDVRGGTSTSSHAHGAAVDMRYLESIGRERCLRELLPWLIDNSHELHISSIHDYIGARLWHAGTGWKPAGKNTLGKYIDPNMGQSWAGWLHIEPTLEGWIDSTPISERFGGTTPPPVIVPIPNPGGPFVHATVKLGDVNADVYACQHIVRVHAGQKTIVDGSFGEQTKIGVINVQKFCGLTADGIVGPKTWAILDGLANS